MRKVKQSVFESYCANIRMMGGKPMETKVMRKNKENTKVLRKLGKALEFQIKD